MSGPGRLKLQRMSWETTMRDHTTKPRDGVLVQQFERQINNVLDLEIAVGDARADLERAIDRFRVISAHAIARLEHLRGPWEAA
jgi:hypothetical protein